MDVSVNVLFMSIMWPWMPLHHWVSFWPAGKVTSVLHYCTSRHRQGNSTCTCTHFTTTSLTHSHTQIHTHSVLWVCWSKDTLCLRAIWRRCWTRPKRWTLSTSQGLSWTRLPTHVSQPQLLLELASYSGTSLFWTPFWTAWKCPMKKKKRSTLIVRVHTMYLYLFLGL